MTNEIEREPGPERRDRKAKIRAEAVKAGHRRVSPMRAIRLRCVDCCAGQMNAGNLDGATPRKIITSIVNHTQRSDR